MNGKKLLAAAKIIAKAGDQIEEMIPILIERLTNALAGDHPKKRAEESDSENEQYSEGGWLLESYLWDIALFEGKRQRPSAHVAVQIVLYDENEEQIPGWEPSVYIMYGSGEGEFNLESFWFCNAFEEAWELAGERLWRWKDDGEEGWGFALPLVKLNSKEDLVLQIVEPVRKLIESNNPAEAFPTDSVAFRFVVEDGNTLHIIVPEL